MVSSRRKGKACAEIGAVYMVGRGVPKDAKEARRWIKAAADAGDVASARWLAANPEASQP